MPDLLDRNAYNRQFQRIHEGAAGIVRGLRLFLEDLIDGLGLSMEEAFPFHLDVLMDFGWDIPQS